MLLRIESTKAGIVCASRKMSTLLFMLKQILSTAQKVCKQKHKHGKHWPMLAYLPVPSFRNSVTCPQASTTSKQAKKTTLWWRTSISNCLQLQEAKSTSQVAFSIITVVCTLPRSHRCSHSSSRLNSKHSTYLLWSFNYCCGLIVQQYHLNLYQAISFLFFFGFGTRICNGFARMHKKCGIMVYCGLLLAEAIRLTSTLWAHKSYSYTAFIPQNWNVCYWGVILVNKVWDYQKVMYVISLLSCLSIICRCHH